MRQAAKRISASALIKSGQGELGGIFVASQTTATIQLNDGLTATAANAVAASDVLTTTGNFSNNETVTIGNNNNITYKFVTTLSGNAYEVLIGASATASLVNLASAINASAGAGTTYGTGTKAHPDVTATSGASTLTATAISAGVAGNNINASETGALASWATPAFTGGLAANTIMVGPFIPAASTFYKMSGGDSVVFENGLYVTITGTVDCTVIFD